MKINYLIFFYLIFISLSSDHIFAENNGINEKTNLYIIPYSDTIKKSNYQVSLVGNQKVVRKFLTSLKSAEEVEMSNFVLMSRGYLIIIEVGTDVSFYRAFEKSNPANALFSVSYTLSDDEEYMLKSFPNGFSAKKLDFNISDIFPTKNN